MKNEALYHKPLQGKLDHISHDERQLIEHILLKYAHVFHVEDTNDFNTRSAKAVNFTAADF